jgi:GWxTD domain-containing protein
VSLAAALAPDPLVADLGPVEAILGGVAPEGSAPTRWRASVAEALERAIERAPENPTPSLALGRIRLRQGLRTEARRLFEDGLQIAVREQGRLSPVVVADLHYERGSLLRDGWLASRDVGRVRGSAFAIAECAPARSSGDAESGFASAERLIAWNYLCPVPFRAVFEEGFELTGEGSAGDLTLMMASFGAAVEAYPAHVGANVDLLVTLASEQRWNDVLAGARRFTRASGGHPDALLLAALALQRLGRPEEAARHFDTALERMDPSRADELCDVSFVLDPADLALYRGLSVPERRRWERTFWASRDRTPSTELNEAKVEHLARATYAHLRFGSAFGDAGEVLIRFGTPNSIHVVGDGSGRLTEFWDYGSGPDITFVRWVAAQRMELTPEGRAYVDDLGKIFPPQ